MRLIALALLASCSSLSGNYFVKGDMKYRVATLDAAEWQKVGFAENDLAWVDQHGHLLAMNSTCKDYGDPSLEVLTNHLMMGFEDKVLTERKTFVLDGRDALESSFTARLDGVPIETTLVVLKKDGCVHDFMYVSPAGHAAEQRAQLDALVDGFTTTDNAPAGRTATVRLGTPEIRPDDGAEVPPEPVPPQEAKAP